MPKHNTYEQDENISDNDIVLGSDAEDNLKTKNFRIGKLKDYFLSFVETIVTLPIESDVSPTREKYPLVYGTLTTRLLR